MLEEYKKRPSDFSRQIIAEGVLVDIRKLESKILKSVKASINEDFYNKHENDGLYFDGWKKGEMTEEHRAKLAAAKRGKKLSENHRKNILNNRKGKKNSPEHKAAIIASRLGSKHSEESRKRMSESRKKNPRLLELASLGGKASAEKRKLKKMQELQGGLGWCLLTFFFNNFQSSQEQGLLESLIIESISVYGLDCFYIPRKLNNYDEVYGADDQSSYENSYSIVCYIENVDGFQGDGNFMSKFGLEIRHQIVVSVAQRIFNQEVGQFTAQLRPNEGDLLYFPLNQKCFQIKYTNKYEFFYQLGGLQTYQLTLELFEYSGEKLNTGIPEIDILQKNFDSNQFSWVVKDENGDFLLTEDGDLIVLEGSSIDDLYPAADNDEIQKESDLFVDFTAQDPFSESRI